MTGNRGFTIGELAIVLVVVAIIAALLFPFVRHVSGKTDKVLCANNLRELGRALYIYAREHDKKFPKTIKVLYDEEYLADESFVDCPASKKLGTPADPDYVYVTKLTVKSPSDEALVKDKVENHPEGGKNILYVNGKVAWEQ